MKLAFLNRCGDDLSIWTDVLTFVKLVPKKWNYLAGFIPLPCQAYACMSLGVRSNTEKERVDLPIHIKAYKKNKVFCENL